MRVCRSPELIAAYRGLHRLYVPRHPPHTFVRLTLSHLFKQSTRYLERVSVSRIMSCDMKSVLRLTEILRSASSWFSREAETFCLSIPRSLPTSVVKKHDPAF